MIDHELRHAEGQVIKFFGAIAAAVETIVPTASEKAKRSGLRLVGGKKTGSDFSVR